MNNLQKKKIASIESLTVRNSIDIKDLKNISSKYNENKKLIQSLEDKVSINENTITILEETVSKHDDKITTSEETVSEHDDKITKLEETVSEHDNKITTLEETVSEHDNKITTLGETVSEHDDKITTLGETVSEHDNKITTLEETVSEHSTIIDLMNYDKTQHTLNIRNNLRNTLKINSNFIGNFSGNVNAGNLLLGEPTSQVKNAKNAFVVSAEKNDGMQNVMTGVQIGNSKIKENVHGNVFDANTLNVSGNATISGDMLLTDGLTDSSDTGSTFNNLAVLNSLSVNGIDVLDEILLLKNKLNELLQYHLEDVYGGYGYHSSYGYGKPTGPPSLLD